MSGADFLKFAAGGDRESSGAPQRPFGSSAAKKPVSNTERFLGGSTTQSSDQQQQPAKSPTNTQRAQTQEAYSRLRRTMESNDVRFNGAGEDRLPRIEQAWSIRHTDPGIARANEDTLKLIANILKDYPTMRCYVHGETGAAKSAPQKLASYCNLHPVNDVKQCMDTLAENRARACLERLVAIGVDRSQLLISFEGEGGEVKVDFIPEGYTSQPVPQREVVVDNDVVRRLEADKRALYADMERLKAEIERLRNARPDDAEKRRADKLEAEVVRLRDLLEMEKRKWESERRTITEKVRAEVERRLYEEQETSRRHISDLNEEIKRLQRELERLLEDNKSLQQDLDSASSQIPSAAGGMDISDLFPMGLAGVQLGSLSRPEWRQLFQQLVAELVRRKRTKVLPAPRKRTTDYRHDDVKSRVDKLWPSRPSYTPPPMPARRDADDFLRWGGGGGGKKGDADDFLSWSGGGGGGGRSAADDFLNYNSGGRSDYSRSKEPEYQGNLGSSASDFLAFSKR